MPSLRILNVQQSKRTADVQRHEVVFPVAVQEVQNVQYCACMNPTAGSFSITPRMQRHFATFAVQMPSADIMRRDLSNYLAVTC